MMIEQQIVEQLQNIEREQQVRIVYACESGSRAWGFASRNSDYDVRFIYVRRQQDYMTLFPPRDVIELPLSDELDINGWDIKKALLLLRKSNPPLLEWLQSPIVYQQDERFVQPIRAIAETIFASKAAMYHYLHMASGNYRMYLRGDRVKTKKYFYVLRPLLAPPIQFKRLVDELVPVNSELREQIHILLMHKKAGDELDDGPANGILNLFIEQQLAYYEQSVKQLSTDAPIMDEQLNELFTYCIQL
jgi:predicted nucleotidyltransferase